MTDEKTVLSGNPTDEGTVSEETPSLTPEEMGEALEAILFAAGYPVPYEKIAEALGMSEDDAKSYAAEAAEAYNRVANRGIMMLVLPDGCQLCTKAAYKEQIRTALGIRLNGKLSPSCLEVLAIIAYHQPVTKAYVEQVRGVDCSYAMGLLTDKSLIEPKDRLEAPGRPFLYGTTDDFLRCFGLSSLADLPENPLLKEAAGEGEAKAAAVSETAVPVTE